MKCVTNNYARLAIKCFMALLVMCVVGCANQPSLVRIKVVNDDGDQINSVAEIRLFRIMSSGREMDEIGNSPMFIEYSIKNSEGALLTSRYLCENIRTVNSVNELIAISVMPGDFMLIKYPGYSPVIVRFDRRNIVVDGEWENELDNALRTSKGAYRLIRDGLKGNRQKLPLRPDGIVTITMRSFGDNE